MIGLTSSPSLLFNLVVYHFACRLFLIMESYIICCFCLIKLQLVQSASTVCYGGFWQHEMAAGDLKSHPVLHHLLLSPLFFFCVCVYLSVTAKSRFGPNRLCGLVLSLGHVGCQEARKCPPCLEDLSVKMLPPNQSLMGHTRHEFECENKHEEGIYNTRHLWLCLCSRLGNCKLTK